MRGRARAWTSAAALAWAAAVHAAIGHAGAAGHEGVAPPARLTDTGLYAPGSTDRVAAGDRPFSPQYPLWTDGAAKSRWIYLPPGSAIDATAATDWVLPVGTRLWKEFRFGGRKVETRMLWRASAGQWVVATYAWNAEQTDAALVPAEGMRDVAEVAPGRFHSIPGVADCAACHGGTRIGPLGFNALQLSTDRDPNALHGESLARGMVTLATLEAEHLLSPGRPDLVADPPRIRTATPEARALLGYFSANCGTCHNRSGEIGPNPPSLHFRDLLENGDAVLDRLSTHRTLWQVPGQPDGTSVMLNPAAPELSAMLVRMRSRRPSSQMPPLGTVLPDDQALDALSRWMQRARH